MWGQKERKDKNLYNLGEYNFLFSKTKLVHCKIKKYLTDILAQTKCTVQECGCNDVQASFNVFTVV
jgi:hypothetical protein